jgi:transposase
MYNNQSENYSFFIGIDISKTKFDVAILDTSGKRKGHKVFNNNAFGFNAMLVWVGIVAIDSPVLYCMEFTGIYSRQLWHFLQDNAQSLWMESGFQIKRKAGNAKGKTDKKDAFMIAEYALSHRHRLKLTYQYDENIELLHDLLSSRNRLLGDLKRLEVPINELKTHGQKRNYEIIKKVNQAAIEGIKKSLKELQMTINELVDANEAWQENIKLATSIKGIGQHTCLWILLYSRNFDKEFTARKFASLAGVAPFESASGSSIRNGSHTHHFSHKFLKGMLHTAAMSAIQFNTAIGQYHKRKKAEGKKGFITMNNVKNKLIHQIFAVIKSKKMYENDYKHPKAA